jgi:hypothetical protein
MDDLRQEWCNQHVSFVGSLSSAAAATRWKRLQRCPSCSSGDAQNAVPIEVGVRGAHVITLEKARQTFADAFPNA